MVSDSSPVVSTAPDAPSLDRSDQDVVVDLRRSDDGSSDGGRALRLVAAAAALVLVVVGALLVLGPLGDDGNNVATIPDPDPPVSSVNPPAVDAETACASYRAADPTVAELEQEADAVAGAGVDRVQTARSAVDALRSDLASSGTADALVLDRLDTVVALLGQAALEVERGLDEQAARTIDQANQTITLAFDTDGDTIPETCLIP